LKRTSDRYSRNASEAVSARVVIEVPDVTLVQIVLVGGLVSERPGDVAVEVRDLAPGRDAHRPVVHRVLSDGAPDVHDGGVVRGAVDVVRPAALAAHPVVELLGD
jgi:hypothetical protein